MALNKADQMEAEEKARKLEAAKGAAQKFSQGAALVENKAEHEAQEPMAQQTAPKNSPWRDNAGMTEDQLRSMERGISGVMNMELHLRLQFIKNRLNMENIGKGRKEKVSVNQLQVQAIEDYTTRMLKKWGYEV